MSNNIDNYPKSAPAQEQSHQPGDQDAMYPEPEVIKKSHQGSGKLKGKIALISGGDSGIGRSVAVLFAREGADVAIIYLEEDDDARTTQQLVEQEGQRCLNIQQDICQPEGVKQAVQKVLDHYSGINILVNNAGIQYTADDLTDIDDEQLKKTFETNFFGVFRLTRAVLPHLHEGDCIINTTSITSYRGSEHLIDYSATKGAITTFTRSLSQNLMQQKRGIRVNGVAPGPIWTPLIPSSFSAEQVAEFGKDTPMGRMGQPSEVAPAYLFLASDDASFITGQVIHVNGGEMVNG